MNEWQPIETAPKDGSVFLAWDAMGRSLAESVCFVEYSPADDDGYHGEFVLIRNGSSEDIDECIFTYWMPLPKPPVNP